MRVQMHRSVSRGVILIFALAAAVFLSYFSIRNALAVHYADLETRQGYERAVRLEPGDSATGIFWVVIGNSIWRTEIPPALSKPI